MTRSLHISFLTFVVVVVAAFTLNSLMRQSREARASTQFLHDRSQLITTTVLRLVQLQDQIHDALVSYRHDQQKRFLEDRRADDREIARVSEDLKHRLDASTGYDLLASYQATREPLATLEERFIDAVRGGRSQERDQLLEEIQTMRQSAASKLHSLLSQSNEHLCSLIDRGGQHQETLRQTLIMRTVTLGFVLCVLLAITWSILRPLHQLTEAANRIAEGDLSVRIDVKSRYGEINQLARDFEKMRERVRENHALLELRIAQRTLDLRQSQERLELALASDEAGLWDWEPEAGRVICNRSWAEMLGYKEEEIKRVEEEFFAKVHPDDVDAVRTRLEEHASGRSDRYESRHRLRKKSGDWIWVVDHGKAVERNGQGRATRVIGLVRDVSNRCRTEEELAEKTRGFEAQARDLDATRQELDRKSGALKQLVEALSKHVRSPLATMRRIIGHLKEDARLGKNDRVLESVEKIEEPADRVHRVVDDLLALSEADEDLARGRVDVAEVVRELTPELQPRLDASGGSLEVQDGMPVITGDRAAVRKVFGELLSNAIAFGCGGSSPRITVGSVSLDDEVRFFVKDNGPGISQENHKKIFGLFERCGAEDGEGGTGAGLALVERILQAHQGRVWVESSPGKGATFWLSFEATSDAASPKRSEREPVPA